jgi:hypothetical protein
MASQQGITHIAQPEREFFDDINLIQMHPISLHD